MAGQIIERGKNTFLIRVFVGRNGQTGKRQYYNQTIHGGKKDAQDALLEALRSRNRSKLTRENTTIGELLDGLHRLQDQRQEPRMG